MYSTSKLTETGYTFITLRINQMIVEYDITFPTFNKSKLSTHDGTFIIKFTK